MSRLNPFNYFRRQPKYPEAGEQYYNEYNGPNARGNAAGGPVGQSDYVYQNRATAVRGYSQPQPQFEQVVVDDAVVVEPTTRYRYHGPFRRPISTYRGFKTQIILSILFLSAVVIVGGVLWGLQAGETCDPYVGLRQCPPNQLMLDIGVGMALAGAILLCLQGALFGIIYIFKFLD